MTKCNYMYASGLRIKEGDGCVVVDGKKMRVVRDGNGKSRVDLQEFDWETGLTEGEISLKDLRAVLAERGKPLITLEVSARTPGGTGLRFYVPLDPSKAMGRQGREGDFESTLRTLTRLSIDNELAEQASVYQLMTLPDSDKQAGWETVARLRLAVTTLGVARAERELDGRFGLLADQDLLDETLAYITSENTLQEPGRAVVRVTGKAISDPSRVSDEHFKLAADWVLSPAASSSKKLGFIDDTFDRLDDASLREALYSGLIYKDTRAAYTTLITDPDRLQRIISWDPDNNPDVSIVRELRNMVTGDPEYIQAQWLASEARKLSVQFRPTEEQKLHRTVLGTPLNMIRSLLTSSK